MKKNSQVYRGFQWEEYNQHLKLQYSQTNLTENNMRTIVTV